MYRRNRRRAPRVDYFAARTVTIEAGTTVDEEGHPAEPIVRVVLDGSWSSGREQRIPVILAAEHVAHLAAALTRKAAESSNAPTGTAD